MWVGAARMRREGRESEWLRVAIPDLTGPSFLVPGPLMPTISARTRRSDTPVADESHAAHTYVRAGDRPRPRCRQCSAGRSQVDTARAAAGGAPATRRAARHWLACAWQNRGSLWTRLARLILRSVMPTEAPTATGTRKCARALGLA